MIKHNNIDSRIRGEIVDLVEEIDFGVIKASNGELLYFYIGNFTDPNLGLDDLSLGDIIVCDRQVQQSDGRLAAINCELLELRGYLIDYLRENILRAPLKVELFDEFCENVREYVDYLGKKSIDIEDFKGVHARVKEAQTVMDMKLLRPELTFCKSKYRENKLVMEFLEMVDEVIKNIEPAEGNSPEVKSFKMFADILYSYISAI